MALMPLFMLGLSMNHSDEGTKKEAHMALEGGPSHSKRAPQHDTIRIVLGGSGFSIRGKG